MRIAIQSVFALSFVYLFLCTQETIGYAPPDFSLEAFGWPLAGFSGYLKETDESLDFGLIAVILHLQNVQVRPLELIVDFAAISFLLYGVSCTYTWILQNVQPKASTAVGLILFAAIDVSTRLPWNFIRDQFDGFEAIEIATLIYSRQIVWTGIFVTCLVVPAKLATMTSAIHRKIAEQRDKHEVAEL